MSYAELSDEDKIIFAAECVGRGVAIPHEIAAHLGHDTVSEIQNPGALNGTDKNSTGPHK